MLYHVSALQKLLAHYRKESHTEREIVVYAMERQYIYIEKDSGITNDANLYATETMNDPKYPLELLQRVITVSQETNKIVASLPALNI